MRGPWISGRVQFLQTGYCGCGIGFAAADDSIGGFMAFTARDGSKHSMASRMRAHNVHSDAKASMGQNKPAGGILDAPDGGEEEQQGDEQDPHAVMAEHGPATATHTMHPAEGEEGEHTVESE